MTNSHFDAFDERKRVDVDVVKIEWFIMDRMLKVSEDIYTDLKNKRASRASGSTTATSRTRPAERLRVRDRW